MNKLDPILEDLNPKQREAVKIIDGPVLVISGPGSGKTKCLTHRTAYLITSGVKPENILALTFTNKAAGEMRERIIKLLHNKSAAPHIGTFHSTGLRILRREIEKLGYATNFEIFDSDDQQSLVKKIMSDLEIDTKRYNPRAVLSKISELKTNLIFPESYAPKDFYQKLVGKIYSLYQEQLKKLNGVDFDDLIVLCVKIFKTYPETLAKYQNFWKYILIDEYQDTSHDQYQFITLLANKYRNLFCIGDDAQSIYQFRRADIRNILNFQKDYPEAKIVMLEQNYRSTQNILSAAQGIISNNKSQIPKELWTENGKGNKILVKELLSERHEANFVVSKISELITPHQANPLTTIKKGGGLGAGQACNAEDIVILYRTHAQSRAMEEALISAGYPYKIVGGIKFYERKEIKDIMAYLRFVINPTNIIAFERIYNVPTRGIGKSVFEKITSLGKPDLLEAMNELISDTAFPPKQLANLKEFSELLGDITSTMETREITHLIKFIIKQTEYEEYLTNQGSKKDFDNSEDKIENLKELLTVAGKYNDYGPGKEGIEKFLEDIALLQEMDKTEDKESAITLMTMHASKGLEFPVVFIIGMEEGLFPHSRSTFEPSELEEERRLCYVAITRAKEHLFITLTKARNIFGAREMNLPSRFIGEIPQHILDYQLFDWNKDEDDIIEY